jgi:hypothetical protein
MKYNCAFSINYKYKIVYQCLLNASSFLSWNLIFMWLENFLRKHMVEYFQRPWLCKSLFNFHSHVNDNFPWLRGLANLQRTIDSRCNYPISPRLQIRILSLVLLFFPYNLPLKVVCSLPTRIWDFLLWCQMVFPNSITPFIFVSWHSTIRKDFFFPFLICLFTYIQLDTTCFCHRLFFMILLAYNSCTGGYTVVFTYVFKIYLSWIYALHHSSSSLSC